MSDQTGGGPFRPPETFCPSCGIPESAGIGQHGMDCEVYPMPMPLPLHRTEAPGPPYSDHPDYRQEWRT